MKTISFSRFLALGILFVSLAVVPVQAKQFFSSKPQEERMSHAGRLAARVRKALQSVGAQGAAAGLKAAVSDGNCVNTQDDCDEDQDGPAGGQAETSIAVDSTGQHIVIGFNDTRGFALNPISVSGVMYSDDGGQTFVDGGQLPSPGIDTLGSTRLPQIFGDPDVKYLGNCTFIYSSIMIKKFSTTAAAQTMSVHVSTDCGHTWGNPIEVTAATNPNGVVVNGAPVDAADKEFLSVDPETGRVMLSWSNFTPFAAGGVEISTTYTDNILDAVNPVLWSSHQVVAATPVDGQSSAPGFAKGSTNAYVAWRRFPSFYTNSIGFARSTDNAQTWSAPIEINSNFVTMDQVLGNDRVNTSPSLDVDNSSGPYSGNVYVTYADNNSFDGADIYVQRSTDGGVTFSVPQILNPKPGLDRAQWFPWVTVDKDTGRVYVFYYDQSPAASGDLTRVSYTFSDNGGATWKTQKVLTDVNFKAGWGNDTGQPNLGDYNQAVAQGGEFFAVWAGTTLPGFTDGQPSGNMNTPDIFFKRLSITGGPQVNVSLVAGLTQVSNVVTFPNNLPASQQQGTVLLSENFNHAAPGSLPTGWIAAHGAGLNVVPWTTSNTFCGTTTNAAFHTNANDGLPNSDPARWERLLSPLFSVPADSNFVTIEFNICYDTEDDPVLPVLGYDGAFLRVTDFTPGHTLRSVLAEAFEQIFTTGQVNDYPKHMPRNSDPNYFPNGDMSMWSGDSQGFKHVKMRMVGMEGTTAQLRFEFAQDGGGICSDVRPGHVCGVAIDNIVVKSVKVLP
jgi:hypothetical protein